MLTVTNHFPVEYIPVNYRQFDYDSEYPRSSEFQQGPPEYFHSGYKIDQPVDAPCKLLYVLSKSDLKKGLIPVPQDKVYPTVGSACCMSNLDQTPKSRTVCILFQSKSCHEGYKCHQIHVYRNFWKHICDCDYFSPVQHFPEEGDVLVMYREKGKTTARCVTVPPQVVYITKGSEAYFTETRRTGTTPYKEVCTYYHKNACNYRYNCNQIHIDCDIWRKFVEMQKSTSPVVTIPERRPLQVSNRGLEGAYFPASPAYSLASTAYSPARESPMQALIRVSPGEVQEFQEGEGYEIAVADAPSPLLPFPPPPTQLSEMTAQRRATIAGLPFESPIRGGKFRRHSFGAALLLSPERPVEAESVIALLSTPESKKQRHTAIKSLNMLNDWNQCGPIGPSAIQDAEDSWKQSAQVSATENSFTSETQSLFSERKASTESGLSSAPSEPKEVIWASYNDKEAKIRKTKDLDDFADLRDAIFTHFTFPKDVVASDLQLWFNDQKLNLHQPVSSLDFNNGTLKVILAEETCAKP